MKKIYYLIALLFAASLGFQSCNNGKTYAELKEEEEDAIQEFITKKGINVISEDEFLKDTVTDVSKNEFVFLEKNGVYMQIVHNDEKGKVLGDGRHDLSTKFVEVILKDMDFSDFTKAAGDTLLTNIYSSMTECFWFTKDGSSFSGKFKDRRSDKTSYIMANSYGTAVPSGWLIPLSYLKLKKYISVQPSENYVKVNLIVPHSEGTSTALQSVYPCYYEITYFLH